MPTLRRRLTLPMACTTLGIVTTLALAWVAPLLPRLLHRKLVWSRDQFWIDDTRAGHYQISREAFGDSVRFLHIIFAGTAKDQPYYRAAPPPAWTFTLTHDMRGEGIAADSPWWGVDTFSTGFPARAFRGAAYEPWPATAPVSPSIQVIPDGKGGFMAAPPPAPPQRLTVGLLHLGSGGRFTIPLRPILSGLAINVVTCSAAWLVIFIALARARAFRRASRGHCPACNYDRQGLADSTSCPECGLASTTAS